jgi:hypothetical protein
VSGTVPVGAVGILCPECGAEIPVPVTATIGNGGAAHEGGATLELDSDMSDLWAHMWTHDLA